MFGGGNMLQNGVNLNQIFNYSDEEISNLNLDELNAVKNSLENLKITVFIPWSKDDMRRTINYGKPYACADNSFKHMETKNINYDSPIFKETGHKVYVLRKPEAV